METWTVQKLLDWTTDYFKKYNIEWPHLEAEILLAHSLDLKRIQLYTDHEKILSQGELTRFKGLIQRRSKHEPIAYITNNQPFMSLDFYVDPSALIPRPETEQLVEIAVDLVKVSDVENPKILDIGTGSGCIAVSLAKFLPKTEIVGIDSSEKVLAIAKKNAEAHKVSDRCEFLLGNILKDFIATKTQRRKEFNIIVSNPPYIRSEEIKKLDPDVQKHEPIAALDGGQDGLDYIKRIVSEAPEYLKTNGHLLVEIGFDQGPAAKTLAEQTGKYTSIEIIKDINGHNRILKAHTL